MRAPTSSVPQRDVRGGPTPNFRSSGPQGSFARRRQATTKYSNPELASLVVVPFLVFAFTCYLFAYIYKRLPLLVWSYIAFMLCASATQCRRGAMESYFPSRFYVALSTLLSLVGAAILGLLVYDFELRPFWFYDGAYAYTNVLPSDDAGGFVDAGMISFADEVHLDTARTMGYKDVSVYCVTPILDDGGIDVVQFWAAGVDCCGKRSAFVCDDAWDPKARSGMVIADVSHFVGDVRDQYMLAVRQAEAAYSLASAKEPIFVRWVKDPEKVRENYWMMGIGIFLGACAVQALLSCLAAGLLHSGLNGLV
mmetsp:Transcript_47051/g.131170  ORF Transcript_47051/g.131170 Transcript_47051/m.131170 type:complete len:309 (+) Transcript_47051:176-1102(+)